MLRILIADDHEVVRRGIKEILMEGFSFVEIGEANDTGSLVKKATEEDWDIIISDLSMPGGGGIDAIGRIRVTKPAQKILIITIYPEEQYAIRVMKAGASGFLNKDTAPDQLIRAVQVILDGRKYIQPTLAEKISDLLGKDDMQLSHESLSKRELDVMIKLAAGFSISEIARQLSLTPNTISTYRSRIMEKMNMNSNDGLAQYAVEHKLI